MSTPGIGLANLARCCDLIREHRHREFGGSMPTSILIRLLINMARFWHEQGRGHGHITLAQQRVLELLDEGCSTTTIADRLYLSPHTVKNHVRAIHYALDAHTRLAAVAEAHRRGLLDRSAA